MSTPYGNDPYGNQGGQNPYGSGGQWGGHPNYGPAGGFPGAAPPKTDAVSIIAFVASLLCCNLIALVLGIIGLSRTSGGKRKGRWAAIAAIVISIISMITIGLLFAVGGAADWFNYKNINDLESGECITAEGLDDSGDEVSQIKVVGCSEDHDGEVIGTKELNAQEADDFVFGDQQQIFENCGTMVPEKVAADLGGNNPKYFLYALTEGASPDEGDKVVCVITLADGGTLTEKLG